MIGQALLEEKAQLESKTVEDVSFDFSLKACSESEFTTTVSTGGGYILCFKSKKSLTFFFRNWLRARQVTVPVSVQDEGRALSGGSERYGQMGFAGRLLNPHCSLNIFF